MKLILIQNFQDVFKIYIFYLLSNKYEYWNSRYLLLNQLFIGLKIIFMYKVDCIIYEVNWSDHIIFEERK